MTEVWVATICLFFGLIIAINLGAAGVADYGNVYGQSSTAVDDYQEQPSDMATFLLNIFTSPAFLAVAAVVLTTRFLSGDNRITILVAIFASMANFLLAPISTISALGLPTPFDWILMGFMNMLLILSFATFAKG